MKILIAIGSTFVGFALTIAFFFTVSWIAFMVHSTVWFGPALAIFFVGVIVSFIVYVNVTNYGRNKERERRRAESNAKLKAIQDAQAPNRIGEALKNNA